MCTSCGANCVPLIEPLAALIRNAKRQSNALTTFNFNSNEIRVVTIDDKPWFVAVDLYDLLYGRRTGVSSRNILDATETITVKRHGASVSVALGYLFHGTRVSHYALISESGLYKLIMHSDRPEARGFQNWVTREVLPTIRKTGSYSVNMEDMKSSLSCGAEAFFHSLYTDVNRSA